MRISQVSAEENMYIKLEITGIISYDEQKKKLMFILIRIMTKKKTKKHVAMQEEKNEIMTITR